ncbi:MAG TPA: DegT/DnrJ/EryC1/StrS family aminotransferase, partial [Armatimonadota bacterium]|nr:DegT/DnrJ/EryC1/StrS family aminotransferase [Armatimonadota bacterium]
GHYERTGVASRFNAIDAQITDTNLMPYAGVPIGGYKHRMNQTCSAMGRVQLKYYPARIAEIQCALHRFWDLLTDVPGLQAHRTAAESGSTMGGWYYARGIYHADEVDGLPLDRFCEAVRAEGVEMCAPGANRPLHTHPVFHTADLFHQGMPTMIAFGQRDVRQGAGTLPISESVNDFVFGVPWFKHDCPELIAEYAQAYRKVAEHAELLL